MTCPRLNADDDSRCQLNPNHTGDCVYPVAGPYLCPEKHWVSFLSPLAGFTICVDCHAVVYRGDPQP